MQDDLFTRLSPEDWNAVTAPKALGILNIHEALIENNQSLDFMVLTSSMANAIDSPGQSNYVAANLAMEAFARYRRSMGLPASVLAICPIGDIGYIADRPKLAQHYSMMHNFLHERELLVFVEHAVLNQQQITSQSQQEQHLAQFGTWTDEGLVYMGLMTPDQPLQDSSCTTIWRGDTRMASFHNHTSSEVAQSGEQRKTTEKMKQLIAKAEADPSILQQDATIAEISTIIGEKLFSLMMREESNIEDLLDHDFKQMGLDSLVLMELRGWWREVIRTDITPLELASKPNLRQLGLCAAEQLFAKHAVKE